MIVLANGVGKGDHYSRLINSAIWYQHVYRKTQSHTGGSTTQLAKILESRQWLLPLSGFHHLRKAVAPIGLARRPCQAFFHLTPYGQHIVPS